MGTLSQWLSLAQESERMVLAITADYQATCKLYLVNPF